MRGVADQDLKAILGPQQHLGLLEPQHRAAVVGLHVAHIDLVLGVVHAGTDVAQAVGKELGPHRATAQIDADVDVLGLLRHVDDLGVKAYAPAQSQGAPAPLQGGPAGDTGRGQGLLEFLVHLHVLALDQQLDAPVTVFRRGGIRAPLEHDVPGLMAAGVTLVGLGPGAVFPDVAKLGPRFADRVQAVKMGALPVIGEDRELAADVLQAVGEDIVLEGGVVDVDDVAIDIFVRAAFTFDVRLDVGQALGMELARDDLVPRRQGVHEALVEGDVTGGDLEVHSRHLFFTLDGPLQGDGPVAAKAGQIESDAMLVIAGQGALDGAGDVVQRVGKANEFRFHALRLHQEVLAPLPRSRALIMMRDRERSTRFVIVLQGLHRFGEIGKQVRRDRQVLDLVIELADRQLVLEAKPQVGWRFGARGCTCLVDPRSSILDPRSASAPQGQHQVLEAHFDVGGVGAGGQVNRGKAQGEAIWAVGVPRDVDALEGGLDVFDGVREAGVAELAVADLAGKGEAELSGGFLGAVAGGQVCGRLPVQVGVDLGVGPGLAEMRADLGAEVRQPLHQRGPDGDGGQIDRGADGAPAALRLDVKVQRTEDVGLAGAVDRQLRQGIVEDGEVDVVDFQDRLAAGKPVVLDDDGALLNDDGGHVLDGSAGGTQAEEVALAIVVDQEAELRPVQDDLAESDFAIEDLFLVVIDDGRGDVEEVGFVEVVAAGHAQLAEVDAAPEVEACGLEADAGAAEAFGELGEDLASRGAGGGEHLEGDDDGHEGKHGGIDQDADHGFSPAHANLPEGPGFTSPRQEPASRDRAQPPARGSKAAGTIRKCAAGVNGNRDFPMVWSFHKMPGGEREASAPSLALADLSFRARLPGTVPRAGR